MIFLWEPDELGGFDLRLIRLDRSVDPNRLVKRQHVCLVAWLDETHASVRAVMILHRARFTMQSSANP